uniref:Uncharacterized protein n=1 Tax=viral metagenome TaxID=1070528 RepID=A0A6M3J4L8_9ZZZZ
MSIKDLEMAVDEGRKTYKTAKKKAHEDYLKAIATAKKSFQDSKLALAKEQEKQASVTTVIVED